MPAYDELRNEFDNIPGSRDAAFYALAKKYEMVADMIENLTFLREELERQGHKIAWP